jgi:hypothetical protein
MVSSAHNHGRNSNAHAAALERWETEGGTIDARRRDHLTKEEAHILRFLGAAVLSRWNGPDSELASHYFEAVLPHQFDEYIWIDRTSAVKPFDAAELQGVARHVSLRTLATCLIAFDDRHSVRCHGVQR